MHFTDQEKASIKQAIAHVEQKTTGEVVTYFSKQSDDYSEALWLAMVLLSLFPTLLLLAFSVGYFALPNSLILTFGGVSAIVAYLAARFIPALLPVLIAKETFQERCMQQAEKVFLEEEVFNTKERIGILIYISELEHQVVVLADKGIHSVVKEGTWSSVVSHIVNGIKAKEKTKGIVDAIYACETILLEHGFVRTTPKTNELNDELREG